MARRIVFALVAALWVGGCGAAGSTAHATVGNLSFDYPAGWTLTVGGNPAHYWTVLAFLTSPGAGAVERCGPDYIPGLGGCTDTLTVPAGTVVVRISEWAYPPTPEGPIASLQAAGWQPATIAGQPAVQTDGAISPMVDTSGQTVTWVIAAPGSDVNTYKIEATVDNLQSAALVQVRALIASLQIPTSTPAAGAGPQFGKPGSPMHGQVLPTGANSGAQDVTCPGSEPCGP